MGRSTAAEPAARRAALLFLAAGLLALVHLGRIPGHERAPVAALGLGDLAVAAALRWLPWRRWPARATLVVVPAASAMVVLFAAADAIPAGAYPLFFMLLYVWLGLSHPPGTSLLVSPLVAAGYVAAPLLHPTQQVSVESVTLAVPVGILIGEVIARTVRRLDLARRDADRRSQELTVTSRRDPLTGLGNRLHAADLLSGLQPGDGVLLLDLDRFKQVNDNDGHAAGDAVLRRLGEYLLAALRDQDTARYGGEEFLVVLHQAADSSSQVAERLNRGWRASNPRTTLSIGVAVHGAGDDPAETLARADAALYHAKRTGRDRVCASVPGGEGAYAS
jgi:diguanylate cyclase (GGDEF)-like protein